MTALPDVLNGIQGSLKPYIKKRNDVASIRRVLACHLDSHLTSGHQQLTRPLSLIDTSAVNINNSPAHSTRGLQKAFLRALLSNSNAKSAYAATLADSTREVESQVECVALVASRQEFLNLVQARQKHDRLRIVQDYVGILGQKPAASQNYLDTKLALRDADFQPSMPSEITNSSGVHRPLAEEELRDLVDRLEKAVLRAKMLLKREQKLLTRIQSENSRQAKQGARLDALGTARNELIVWIETELSRAGESSPDHGETAPTPSRTVVGKGYLQKQTESSKLHYARYISSRKELILATEEQSTPIIKRPAGDTDSPLPTEISSRPDSLIPTIAPYLEEFMSISDDQKAMIQQKSHVAISLAKQSKEVGQGLDRLADESHLLPEYPLSKTASTQVSLGASISFGDEVSNGETPDLSRRAQAWVFATASANTALKESVSERLDEGGKALLEAQESLLDLLGFLGNDVETHDGAKEDSSDAWAALNGKLGVF